MLGYTPPPPRFWKALAACAPFVALIAWSLHLFHVGIPTRILIVFSVVAWLALAAMVHARVSNDWRSQYAMNLEVTERRTTVAPNTRIEKK